MLMYTVDRIEDGYYVLLKKGNEEDELLIPVHEVRNEAREGDVVSIVELDGVEQKYELHVRTEVTSKMREDVTALLRKLQNK
ncbi:DUF3006 domain-containing protein [Savagea sp. SN6]|uniref:DUF3006 domain-containing protein n=1 Tax=Savagea serpentis TaxID=2785297 RepID=A0A8J7GJ71_9BACL|nr:DUF3006 domain-containing protein [Savagea serpentis]MBF4500855.1 DUF3006 domain-containing protein [Savagea serpentis]